MPIESPEQARFFRLCLDNPDKATKPCPPRRVILEFFNAENRARQDALASGKES